MRIAPYTFAFVSAVSMTSACSFTPAGDAGGLEERTSTTQEAISNGQVDDVEDPSISDVVVSLAGSNDTGCSGTLISPTAVLTAGHCLCSGDYFFDVTLGSNTGAYPPPPKYRAMASSAHLFGSCPFDLGNRGADLAILFLDANIDPTQVGPYNYTLPPVLTNPVVERPSLTSPCASSSSSCPDVNGGFYSPPFGMAGYAGTDTRTVTYGPLFEHEPGNPDGRGQYWSDPGLVSVGQNNILQKGDSGGPLFVERTAADGHTYRDVMGVASTYMFDPISLSVVDYWTDITRGAPKSWVQSVMVDTTRTADWHTRHPGYSWIGEVDYLGACQWWNDTDCDHWFDWQDDCRYVFNPDQKETVKPGIGDACLPPPPPILPTCSSSTSCPAGWNDTPPEATITCQSNLPGQPPVQFFAEPPTSGSTPLATGTQYVTQETGQASSVYACNPTSQGPQCVSISTYAALQSWCFTSTGSSSGGGYTGGKFGCQGTCQ